MTYFGMINPITGIDRERTDTMRLGDRAQYTHQPNACFQNVLREQQMKQIEQMKETQSTKLNVDKEKMAVQFLYQNYLMQQMYMPYRMNLYSGYANPYGLYGMQMYNNYGMMTNSLFSTVVGDLL